MTLDVPDGERGIDGERRGEADVGRDEGLEVRFRGGRLLWRSRSTSLVPSEAVLGNASRAHTPPLVPAGVMHMLPPCIWPCSYAASEAVLVPHLSYHPFAPAKEAWKGSRRCMLTPARKKTMSKRRGSPHDTDAAPAFRATHSSSTTSKEGSVRRHNLLFYKCFRD
jgi:hypothetical protein